MSSMESLNTDTTEQQEQLVPKKNAVSVIWTHFGFSKDDIEQNEVRCRHCRKTVSTPKGNITNLFQHLKHNHVTEYEQCMAQKKQKETDKRPATSASAKQMSITQAFTNATQYEKSTRKWKEITDTICYYIAKDMTPLATVERSGFKHLVKTLDRRYTVPSRSHFSKTALPDMYKTCCKNVAAELKNVQHFAATYDLWSSRTMDPFLSLTLHYIDDDWKLRQRCLETAYFPADHTADMIAQGLKDMLSEWDLVEEKLSAITTDNKAEMSSYLVSPMLDSEANPLDWWRKHHVHFPTLSKVAKKYICVPATSSPSERVFSSGGNIVTCLRSCLKPEKVNMLVFLSKNLE
ncbi:E3 SUMO-protein ligase ZBED1-like [Erpetoichthys calabaricus]|uniref:E3 SUMO-protein ligase ZBED1-like n=1 Tax=Erpetoichthys calabaricus TaxID=27687 RepID=UPI002234E87A|nr:E3 SUMO-protein ligase ZBED1-like [Erpetoichthys calabaricus]